MKIGDWPFKPAGVDCRACLREPCTCDRSGYAFPPPMRVSALQLFAAVLETIVDFHAPPAREVPDELTLPPIVGTKFHRVGADGELHEVIEAEAVLLEARKAGKPAIRSRGSARGPRRKK